MVKQVSQPAQKRKTQPCISGTGWRAATVVRDLPDLAVESDLCNRMPITSAEADAVIRLLGDELEQLLGGR